VPIPRQLFGIAKEILRHLLRRPVVGIVALARTKDGKIVLIRRGDTGEWSPPGGTLEWGETLQKSLPRELKEEAGVTCLGPGKLLGVYSGPERDARFHAVTVVVEVMVSEPAAAPVNALEILEVKCFAEHEIPSPLAHGMGDILANALAGRLVWE
jgi:8-oxo-dGTP diphosphatase